MSKKEFTAKHLEAVQKYYKNEVLGNCAVCDQSWWEPAGNMRGLRALEFSKKEGWEWGTDTAFLLEFHCKHCGNTVLINWHIAQTQASANGTVKCMTCKQDVPKNNLSDTPEEPECEGCYKRERSYILGVLRNRGCTWWNVEDDLKELMALANKAGISNLDMKEIASEVGYLKEFGSEILIAAGVEYDHLEESLDIPMVVALLRKRPNT